MRRSLPMSSVWHRGGGITHRVLFRHFFHQLLTGNDTGGSETSLVRALAIIAAPMLMAAFWIVTLARGLLPWPAAGIHFLFVFYSFCSMGCVTALCWERLFPERLDFLVLLPMPLRGRSIFAAKLCAVGAFLSLFLLAANVFGTLLLPALAGLQMVLRAMAAHAAAVFAAGMASALAVLAFESLVVALLPDRWVRYVVPCLQALLVASFLGLFLRVNTVMDALPSLLSGGRLAQWSPPLWFLCLYEVRVGGPTATALAYTLAWRAFVCLPILVVAATLLYPAAWARRKRMALEGTRSARLRDAHFWEAVIHKTVLYWPDGRAVFHFMRQTLARQSSYHARLAAYAGAGLALGLTVGVRVELSGRAFHLSVSPMGAQATLPLLLFWTIAGLRTAFLLPTELSARWIFRMADLSTRRVISTTKVFVFIVCCAVIALVLLVLKVAGWQGADLWLQCAFGIWCAILLIDLFFYLEAYVPFTRPQLTERSSLPMTLAVYVFGLPVLGVLMVALERWTGHSVWRALAACSVAAAVHFLLRWLRRLPSHPSSEDVFLDELTEAVQTLGLSR